ncbi:histidine phosphatase family protein [Biformimicrobium ophioploci]|uniref:Histidine phosphatase family protein n=1 Tax=Biformimicrobium ophioploci TaxID=3036711 RepID=A0ABQ6LXD3_9GAMM|nr:histidine phosphatase family protein [Microbulbifer sp. NKW57]GMG86723.1 histidine phosphatase family protein [Microbulbifer sp. NKW57]
MAEFFTVRHGQASLGSENYDQLSPLGERQSRWLGEHFRGQGVNFDRVICGDLVRHRQTAEAICAGMGRNSEVSILQCFAELNEFDFQEIISAYLRVSPERRPPADADQRVFFSLLRDAMHAWIEGQLDVAESWQAFEQRVQRGMEIIVDGPGRTLVVSSGGTISMLTRLVLEAPASTVVQLNMQTRNTSLSRFFFKSGKSRSSISLHSFNHTPHLEHPERQDAITYG